jgi:hypothetical protein
LRDYLYIPLGGNRTGHRTRNLMITMLLGGLWHGAAWQFVAWGGWHGVLLVGAHRLRKIGLIPDSGTPATRARVWTWRQVTFLLVVLGWLLFRADGIGTAGRIMQSMIGLRPSTIAYARLDDVVPSVLAICALLWAWVNFVPNSFELAYRAPSRLRWAALSGAALACCALWFGTKTDFLVFPILRFAPVTTETTTILPEERATRTVATAPLAREAASDRRGAALRFALVFVVTFLLIWSAAIAVHWIGNPDGIFPSSHMPSKRELAWKVRQFERLVKQNRAPTILVLGSSRMMQVSPPQLEKILGGGTRVQLRGAGLLAGGHARATPLRAGEGRAADARADRTGRPGHVSGCTTRRTASVFSRRGRSSGSCRCASSSAWLRTCRRRSSRS